MAATDAQTFPIRGQICRLYGFIRLSTTGNVCTTGLGTLTGTIYKDGGTGVATGSTPVEVTWAGPTYSGHFYVDLSPTEMTADTVAVKVASSTANAMDCTFVIYPLRATEPTDDVWAATQKRFEHFVYHLYSRFFGRTTRNNSSGTITVYKASDDTTAIGTQTCTTVGSEFTVAKL